MFNFVEKFNVLTITRSKAIGLALFLCVVFLSPDSVLSAQTAGKNEKCDQILDQAVDNNDNNTYLKVLQCELEEASDAFAAAGGATLGTVAILNQPNIPGGDITLNPPSTGGPGNPIEPVIVVTGTPAGPVATSPIIVSGIPAGPVVTSLAPKGFTLAPVPSVIPAAIPVGTIVLTPVTSVDATVDDVQ